MGISCQKGESFGKFSDLIISGSLSPMFQISQTGFCPLASGSKGNSIFFASQQTNLLIDAGLSGKGIAARLSAIGRSVEEIDAILITHEHLDHIQGLKVLAYRKQIPVLCNAETAKGIISLFGEGCPFKIFSTGETFEFKDLEIHPFSVQHDTLDPVAFTIKTEGLKIGFCTDLGFATTLVKNKLKACNYLYVEANHQESLVHGCSRPMSYKQRVLGRCGHLSNAACADLVASILHDELKEIYLAHLSEECNRPDLAKETVLEKLESLGVSLPVNVAMQHEVSKPINFNTSNQLNENLCP